MSRIIGKVYSNVTSKVSKKNMQDNVEQKKIDLESMTIEQLTEMAADAGIRIPPKAKKSDIIAVIEDELDD